MPFFVTRQRNWPDGEHVIQIMRGRTFDCVGAGHIGDVGECEYQDPTEAVHAAKLAAGDWPKCEGIEYGPISKPGQLYMEFARKDTERDYQDLDGWAQSELEHLPKCEHCGELLGKTVYVNHFQGDDEKFCSSYCAEEYFRPSDDEEEDDELLSAA